MKEKRLAFFKFTVLVMVILEIYSIIELAKFGTRPYIIFAVAMTIICVMFILQLIIAQDNMHKFVAELDSNISLTEKESLYSFPVSSVITDENYKIVWCNKFFTDNIKISTDPFGAELSDIFTVDIEELERNNTVSAFCDEKVYTITSEKSLNNLKILCFQDISEYHNLQEVYRLTRPYVVIITVDNYEDLMQNLKESDKSRVVGEMEKLFEDFISSTNGFLKKVSQNTFFAVIEEQYLSLIIEEKFKILDTARKIKVDDRLNLTLSIGVGYGASTLAESEVFAKQSLDMALGRGGDQAAVKTDTGFRFYGGVSKGIEKQSRIKTRIIANALQEFIHNSSDVYIMGHKFGDLDSIGAAVGLAASIATMGKPVKVVVDPEKNLAKPIIDRIKANNEGDMFIDEKTALEKFSGESLLIIVDTHNPDIIESPLLYAKAKGKLVVIDHHRKTVNFIDNAVIFHHEPYASSACEMVTEIIQYFQNTSKIQPYHADALLAGITLDTKNFVMKTGVRTFEAAAFLRKNGADTVIVKSMFSGSMTAYKQRAKLVASAEIYNHCAIAVAEKNTENLRIVAPQASDELLNIVDVDASFVIYEYNGCVSVSARSFGTINVQLIMERLGGGGHQTMAATQIHGKPSSEVKEMLFSAIDEYIESCQLFLNN